MKNQNCSAIFFVLLSVLCIFDLSAKRNREIIHTIVDYPPVFNGDMERFLQNNFRYPKEAWKREKTRSVALDVVVHSTGSASLVSCRPTVDTLLYDEISRVVEKMSFFPATNNGNRVSCSYKLLVSLANNSKYGEECYPYGLGRMVTDAEKKLNNILTSGNPITEDMGLIEEAVGLFPGNPALSSGFARIMTTLGDKDVARTTLDNSYAVYSGKYKDINQLKRREVSNLRGARPGYSSKTQIGLGVLRSMFHKSERTQNCDSIMTDLLDFIDARIVDGDINDTPNQRDVTAYQRRMEQMQREIVEDFSRNKVSIDRSTPLWERLTRYHNIGEISSSLRYWSEQGWIDNAQVNQMTALIKKERQEMVQGKNADKEVVNLFGVKAFVIWLRDGDSALEEYLGGIQTGPGSDKLKKFAVKLQTDLQKQPDLLSDRDAVIRAFAMVHPASEGEAASRYRDMKSRVSSIFRLNWLMEKVF